MKLASVLTACIMWVGSSAWALSPWQRETYAVVKITQWDAFVRAEGGILLPSENLNSARDLGVRIGLTDRKWEFSYGYSRAEGTTDGARLLPGDLSLNTLDVEAARMVQIPQAPGLMFRASARAGYTVPTLESAGMERLDNGISGSIGGGLNYAITNNLHLGVGAHYFVFRTDSHRETEVVETVPVFQNGVQIGTADVFHFDHTDDRIKFDGLKVLAAVTYTF